jgi:hypothetical protein
MNGIPSIPLQPPSDNLYKFLAIFGLIIFLASGFCKTFLLSEYNQKLIDISFQHLLISDALNKSDTLIRNNNLYMDSVRNYMFRYLTVDCAATSVENATKNYKLFLENNNANITVLHNQHDSLIKPFSNTYLMKDALTEQVDNIRRYSKLGLILGVMLMFVGFVCWYEKYQIYNDLLISKELNENKTFDYNSARKVALIQFNWLLFFLLIIISFLSIIYLPMLKACEYIIGPLIVLYLTNVYFVLPDKFKKVKHLITSILKMKKP